MPPICYMAYVRLYTRSWNRTDLISLLENNKYKVGAEIGVYNGEFSSSLCKYVSGLKLYMVDPYKVYKDKTVSDSQKVHDKRYEMVEQIAKEYNTVLLRMTSKEAISQIKEPLDFVYIDANHTYDDVIWDVENWSKKVREGGIVAGHDFSFGYLNEVPRGVFEIAIKLNVDELIVLEPESSWFFYKGKQDEKSIDTD